MDQKQTKGLNPIPHPLAWRCTIILIVGVLCTLGFRALRKHVDDSAAVTITLLVVVPLTLLLLLAFEGAVRLRGCSITVDAVRAPPRRKPKKHKGMSYAEWKRLTILECMRKLEKEAIDNLVPVKAYCVIDETVDAGEIVFAHDMARAAEVFWEQLEIVDADDDNLTVYRKPEYDGYAAQGEVPYSVLLDDGEIMLCSGCDAKGTKDDGFIAFDSDYQVQCKQCREDIERAAEEEEYAALRGKKDDEDLGHEELSEVQLRLEKHHRKGGDET